MSIILTTEVDQCLSLRCANTTRITCKNCLSDLISNYLINKRNSVLKEDVSPFHFSSLDLVFHSDKWSVSFDFFLYKSSQFFGNKSSEVNWVSDHIFDKVFNNMQIVYHRIRLILNLKYQLSVICNLSKTQNSKSYYKIFKLKNSSFYFSHRQLKVDVMKVKEILEFSLNLRVK